MRELARERNRSDDEVDPRLVVAPCSLAAVIFCSTPP